MQSFRRFSQYIKSQSSFAASVPNALRYFRTTGLWKVSNRSSTSVGSKGISGKGFQAGSSVCPWVCCCGFLRNVFRKITNSQKLHNMQHHLWEKWAKLLGQKLILGNHRHGLDQSIGSSQFALRSITICNSERKNLLAKGCDLNCNLLSSFLGSNDWIFSILIDVEFQNFLQWGKELIFQGKCRKPKSGICPTHCIIPFLNTFISLLELSPALDYSGQKVLSKSNNRHCILHCCFCPTRIIGNGMVMVRNSCVAKRICFDRNFRCWNWGIYVLHSNNRWIIKCPICNCSSGGIETDVKRVPAACWIGIPPSAIMLFVWYPRPSSCGWPKRIGR